MHKMKGQWANRVSDPKEGDFFPTQRSFVDLLINTRLFKKGVKIWEPACGDGSIARAFMERGYSVHSSDLFDHGYGWTGVDFLKARKLKAPHIVTNPPFSLFDDFYHKSRELKAQSITLMCSLPCLGSSLRRYWTLWEPHPPQKIFLIAEKQKVLGKNSMFSHIWCHWGKGVSRDTQFVWLTAKQKPALLKE